MRAAGDRMVYGQRPRLILRRQLHTKAGMTSILFQPTRLGGGLE
jgi:hypothetical protein